MKLTSLALLALLLVGSAGAGCLGQDADDAPENLDLAASDDTDDDALDATNATSGMPDDAADVDLDNGTAADGNATDDGAADNETEPTPPPPPPAPSKPADHVASHSGWIEPAPEGFVATHVFPVQQGVRNVSIRVSFDSAEPSGQAPSQAPLQWNVTVLSPSGDTVDNDTNLEAGSVDEDGVALVMIGDADGATFDLGDLTQWGMYTLRIEARGGVSDGDQWGHRYNARIYVDY